MKKEDVVVVIFRRALLVCLRVRIAIKIFDLELKLRQRNRQAR